MPDWNWWDEFKERTACSHETKEPKRYTKANGVVCVALQCRRCGEKIQEVAKKNYHVDSLPWLNEEYRDKVRARKSEIQEGLRAKWELEQRDEIAARETEWHKLYDAYLQSDHWKDLRCTVISRDKGQCQNCFAMVTQANAHVHHESYVGLKRVGYSFAFECITLCRKCHKNYHGEPVNEQQNGARRALVR